MSNPSSGRATDRRTFIRQGAAAALALGVGGALAGCEGAADLVADGPAVLDGRGEQLLDLTRDLAPDAGADLASDLPGDGPGSDAVDGVVPGTRPVTTARQRIAGVLALQKQPASTSKQWGVTQLAAGEKHQRTDLLKVDATAGTATGSPASLLYLTHLTDVHIVDEESPARTVSMDDTFSSAWRHQEAHSTQVLDAMVRKVNKFHAFRPMDLVLVTGDCIDNNQKNELSWFLGVMAGGSVFPNSGSLEDPVTGLDNDPHDALTSVGLGTIPWFLAFGNHDALIQGNFVKDSGGGKYSWLIGDPTRSSVALPQLGRVNPPACNALSTDTSPLPLRCEPTDHAKLKTGSLASDTERIHLSRTQWMNMAYTAAGLPVGHGLGASNVSSGRGDYTVDPVAGLPLRLVMLDTAADTFPPGAAGTYSDERITNFLLPALKQAVADQVLVIVSSHHPSDSVMLVGGKLRSALSACPNVILHLAGHTHQHRVTPRPGATPALGYWEVETSSLSDWPQQGRLVELVDNRDGTGEVWLTVFDYDTDHKPLGPLVEGSRFFALWEVHSGEEGSSGEGKATSRNVVLPVVIPPEVGKKLALLPGKPIESKLFT